MAKAPYKIPFRDGSLQHYPEEWRGGLEWKDNYTFNATLTYQGFRRGRSAAYVEWSLAELGQDLSDVPEGSRRGSAGEHRQSWEGQCDLDLLQAWSELRHPLGLHARQGVAHMTTCYRPTTLKLASANCPRAVDFYEQNLPRFREHFSQGIAAHDCLAVIGESVKVLGRAPDLSDMVRVCESTARHLIAVGRRFEDEQEPPMVAEDAYAGMKLALDYATNERTIWPVSDVWYERGLAFDEAWKPVQYDAKNRRFRLILDMMFITEDGGDEYSGRVAVVRDYKSSWATDESEISTFQMKAQAVAASIVLPDLDGVRREAVNLRTGQTFGETLWLEQGGREQLAEWRDEITAYMDALDKMRDANGRRPTRPGAGCLSCAWVMHCDFAAPMADSAMALAQLLAQNEGRRAQLIKMLKGATSEKSIEFDTTSVGYHVKPKREPKPDATRLAWEEWKKQDGDIDGFIAALRPSLGGLENVAELLVKKSMGKHEAPPESMDALDMAMLDRFGPAIDASAAASLAAQWIETKNGREFGVQRKA